MAKSKAKAPFSTKKVAKETGFFTRDQWFKKYRAPYHDETGVTFGGEARNYLALLRLDLNRLGRKSIARYDFRFIENSISVWRNESFARFLHRKRST